MTTSGFVSNHTYGRGLDIASIDGEIVSPGSAARPRGRLRAVEFPARSGATRSARRSRSAAPATSPTPRTRTTSTSASRPRSPRTGKPPPGCAPARRRPLRPPRRRAGGRGRRRAPAAGVAARVPARPPRPSSPARRRRTRSARPACSPPSPARPAKAASATRRRRRADSRPVPAGGAARAGRGRPRRRRPPRRGRRRPIPPRRPARRRRARQRRLPRRRRQQGAARGLDGARGRETRPPGPAPRHGLTRRVRPEEPQLRRRRLGRLLPDARQHLEPGRLRRLRRDPEKTGRLVPRPAPSRSRPSARARGQSINDPSQFGEWIADVERPAAQYRYRYQLRLDEANRLLKSAPPPRRARSAAPAAAPGAPAAAPAAPARRRRRSSPAPAARAPIDADQFGLRRGRAGRAGPRGAGDPEEREHHPRRRRDLRHQGGADRPADRGRADQAQPGAQDRRLVHVQRPPAHDDQRVRVQPHLRSRARHRVDRRRDRRPGQRPRPRDRVRAVAVRHRHPPGRDRLAVRDQRPGLLHRRRAPEPHPRRVQDRDHPRLEAARRARRRRTQAAAPARRRGGRGAGGRGRGVPGARAAPATPADP